MLHPGNENISLFFVLVKLLWVLVASFVGMNGAGVSSTPTGKVPSQIETRLRIVHINDVYELDAFPRLKTLIDEQRATQKNCLVVLPGDFLAPSLLSSLDKGAGMVTCLNLLGVDIVCFGNHENDVDINSLRKRVKEFRGDWLNSNMPGWVSPKLPAHVTKELTGEAEGKDGKDVPATRRVSFLGFLIGGEGFQATYRDGSFGGASSSILSVLSCHETAVKTLRDDDKGVIDCIVPLTHQDMAEDRTMAATGHYPIIVGGHDHDVIHEMVPVTSSGKPTEGTAAVPVIKAGMNAENAALIDLVWAEGVPRGEGPSFVQVELVRVADYAPNREVAIVVKKKMEPVRALDKATLLLLSETLLARYSTNRELSSKRTRFGPSTFATFLATLGAECMKTDFCAINAGAVRGDTDYKLEEDGGTGRVTYADLQRECPFPSSVVVATCSGAVLAEAVEESRAGWYVGDEPEEASGALHCDVNATVEETKTGCRLVSIGGAPLEPNRLYSALLDSYDIRKTPALTAWKEKHPEYFPPDDAGRPMLPILVERLAKMLFLALVDADGDGKGNNFEEIDAVFAEFDTNDETGLCVEELTEALKSKLGENGASSLVAKTMLSIGDTDGDGVVSRRELHAVMEDLASG